MKILGAWLVTALSAWMGLTLFGRMFVGGAILLADGFRMVPVDIWAMILGSFQICFASYVGMFIFGIGCMCSLQLLQE